MVFASSLCNFKRPGEMGEMKTFCNVTDSNYPKLTHNGFTDQNEAHFG